MQGGDKMLSYLYDEEKVEKFRIQLEKDIMENENNLKELQIYYELNVLPKYICDEHTFHQIKKIYNNAIH